jgi:hypothetical protein
MWNPAIQGIGPIIAQDQNLHVSGRGPLDGPISVVPGIRGAF